MELLPVLFSSVILKHFSDLTEFRYAGFSAEGFLQFDCRRGDEAFRLIVLSVFNESGELLWQSIHEILGRTLKEAAQVIQGFYGFDLLSFESGDSIRTFQWGNLRQLIVNHARNLEPGEERLIQYTSLFGILKKRIPETFGKIEGRFGVKVLKGASGGLDALVKKLLKAAPEAPRKAEILICDLSQDPLFRFGEEEQTLQLEKVLKTSAAKAGLPPVYVQDARGFVELGLQFGLRDLNV